MFIDKSACCNRKILRPDAVLRAGLGVVLALSIFVLNTEISRAQSANVISTIAGTGGAGFSGDGGPATKASLNQPVYVAIGPDGSVYIAEINNHRIRKIVSTGIISTVAGTGGAGFSGDGGPATAAALNSPLAVAVDGNGNLYIADTGNARIRMVDTAGTIRTVAGTGSSDFTGDGGPATSAALNAPTRIALDAAGNLYIADQNNQRIRKVDTAGIITTVAGSEGFGRGAGSYSGEGGLATKATFNNPTAVAVDAAGNIYISDQVNHRVRKVAATTGIVTTIAGNGAAGFTGDNGAGVSASLNDPAGLAVDSLGNVYVGDNQNARIRRIDPTGVITTVVGNGTPGFSGDGGAATSASINNPFGVAVDSSGNLYIADVGNNRVRKVALGVPAFQISPPSVSLSLTSDAAPSSQQVVLTSTTVGIIWTAQATTQNGQRWLSLSSPSGSTPSIISIGVNSSGLPPGVYAGRVAFQFSQGIASLAVTLTVQAPVPAAALVDATTLVFQSQAGGDNPAALGLRIANASSTGFVNWTAQASTGAGGNWLSVSPTSGSASSNAPASVQVSANATSLAAGVYTGSVVVQTAPSGPSTTVTVTLVVSQTAPTMVLSQTGLFFTAAEGAVQVPPQSYGIQNSGLGTMNWTSQASTLTGSGWLQIAPGSGTSGPSGTTFSNTQVSVNAAGLGAGQYYGLIRVDAPGATNTPQVIPVFLNVTAAGSSSPPQLQTQGAVFVASGALTSTQSVTISTSSSTPVQVSVGVQTTGGGNWLDAQPRSLADGPRTLSEGTRSLDGVAHALISAGRPGSVTIQANLAGMTPGTYTGLVILQFSDGSPPQIINVVLVVPRVSGAGQDPHYNGVQPSPQRSSPQLEGCIPTKVIPTLTSIGANFSSPVAWPSLVNALVVDDCGENVTNAAVLASFSNGDPPIALSSLNNGNYTGTWRPLSIASRVTVTVRADLSPLAGGVAQAQGSVQANAGVPLLFPGGLVNNASFSPAAPLAPSTITAVFGRSLAAQGAAAAVPLPTVLGGATLTIGGIDAPFFFTSDGQLAVQLPAELSPNTRQQAFVKLTTPSGVKAVTLPETITIAAARPGIFTTNQQGSGQGIIRDVQFRLIDPSAPAAIGDAIQIFATGLGATQPPVPTGQQPPTAEPLARVSGQVQVTIGGQQARVLDAVLTAFVGLYQVNAVIPAGITPNPNVPVVISVDGVPSNTATIAVRNQ